MGTRTTPTPAVPPFETESMYVASALLASGLSLESADEASLGRFKFRFTDERAASLAFEYIQNTLQVNAQTLFMRFDDLRTLVRRGSKQGTQGRR